MENQPLSNKIISNISSRKISRFQEIIIEYYKENGRDFPWRNTKDPWKILLSEILLRKTTAKQVALVYNKISNFSVNELAKIDENKLSGLLEHLGMHKERAKLLKQIAEIVEKSGLEELSDIKFLESLPGVGPYARNAVLCFSFDQPVPALDRNMIRILQRAFSIKSEKTRPHTDKALWKIAALFVPMNNCKEYNWGILDLSAEYCRPNNPNCEDCPINNICDRSL